MRPPACFEPTHYSSSFLTRCYTVQLNIYVVVVHTEVSNITSGPSGSSNLGQTPKVLSATERDVVGPADNQVSRTSFVGVLRSGNGLLAPLPAPTTTEDKMTDHATSDKGRMIAVPVLPLDDDDLGSAEETLRQTLGQLGRLTRRTNTAARG